MIRTILRWGLIVAASGLALPHTRARAEESVSLTSARRVIFLGDSITYAGGFVDDVEAAVRLRDPEWRGEILDLGVPSETVSGLSEAGHAGGKFPRPHLHERLDRVLEQTKPDLVIAGYGMNDGIYSPFSEERFQKYQEGIRLLREKVTASKARIVFVTPAVFDPQPIKGKTLPLGAESYGSSTPYAEYNAEVVGRYSAWLLAQRSLGWDVIDAHSAMQAALAEHRKIDPNFAFTKDGVHPNAEGHVTIARAILMGFGFSAADAAAPQRLHASGGDGWLSLIQKRRKLLSDSWLTAIGHKRPGMTPGLPLAEAAVQAAALAAQIAQGPSVTAPKIRVLIIDGINNHDWQTATAWLKPLLNDSGRFTADVSTTPPRGSPETAWDGWRPKFSDYDVVLSNFNGGHKPDGLRWPREVEAAFETYVRGGGGFVSFHAANNAFLDWPAYNEMIGLLWRDQAFGPGIIIDKNEKTVIVPVGEGRGPGHGPRHDFTMTLLDRDHPITRGLPRTWPHPSEQLTHGQHGPEAVVNGDALKILTYAWSKDINEREPMDWVREYGKGRVYVTMLGHTWKNEPNPNLADVGFQTLFLRGVEWAATGKVTIPVPANFPAATAGAK